MKGRAAECLIATLLALPSWANATLLYVDYEGTVDEFDEHSPPGYEPGQRLEGRLIIDTSLAGPDRSTLSWMGYYGIDHDCEFHPDFVTGFVDINPAGGADTVVVLNDDPYTGEDRYAVSDSTATRGFTFTVSASVPGLLSSTDIVQSFDLTEAEAEAAGGSIGAAILDGVEDALHVTLHRLSVRPAVCAAPST
jgi:hypothetical protein